MPMWKISNQGKPVKVAETKLKDEKIMEENLEDWIITDPSILNEPLLVIGRQVMIPDIKDRLDVLALDPFGYAVIVELKRGKIKDPVDMQALRYASYISKWRFEDFENQAKNHIGKNNEDFNFNETYEQFCIDSGNDESPDLNSDQRIIIVGAEVKEKLGSVALWLNEHSINIKIIEVEILRDGDSIFIQPHLIIPLPVSKFSGVGEGPILGKPWLADSRSWHLEKRCSPETKEMLLKLDDIIQDNFEISGPQWNQKFYVSYQIGNYNWLFIETHSGVLKLRFIVNKGTFNQSKWAKALGVAEYDKDDSLSEKLNLPSSLEIRNRTESNDRMDLRIKSDFDVESETFMKFLKEAYNAFSKSQSK